MVSGADRRERWVHYGIGGVVFLVSMLTYMRTVAPTTSFWDCGEFIACSRTLSVMHPPGAPLYLLIGRIMTMLPIAGDIGLRVNLFSVLVSAATVLLTYLVVVQLVRRWRGEVKGFEDRLIVYGSGVIGALGFAFTDSFWFNAVEAEVYAFSMFFTALVVWLALVWEERSREAGSVLLIIFIFYLFGLATGVHLLNILTFPFVLLIAFFHDHEKVKRLLLLLTVQAGLPFLLYVVLYQYNPAGMNYTELLAHQGKASAFLKWFGLIWVGVTLVYMYVKDRDVFAVWWVIPGLVLLAYSTYLVIYVRAGLGPPINENAPSTREAMMYYLARKQYGEEDLLLTFLYRKAPFWEYQVQKMYTRYLGWQFIGKGEHLDYQDRIIEVISFRGLYGLPFLLGVWGAVHHFFKDWRRALAVLVLFFLTGYAIIVYLNQPDPQPRERDYSYVGSFFAFALWVGVGLAGVLEWVSQAVKKVKLRRVLMVAGSVLVFAAVPLNLFAVNFDSHDRSGNYVAYDYSYNILETCEPNSILFTNGDNDTFPLWFLQEVYGIRKDVRVVCLSLLNTDWYIKQLRDMEPRVPMQMTDKEIGRLAHTSWKPAEVGIPVPADVRESCQAMLHASRHGKGIHVPDTLRFTLNPTYPENNPSILQIKDYMVLRIIMANRWRKPVYFALTVSPESRLGLDPFLRNDGLATRLVPYPVGDVDPDILKKRLLGEFKYRSVNDPDVYLNEDTKRLMINVRQSFLQLTRYYLNTGQPDSALFILSEMSKAVPEQVVPFASELYALNVADHYRRAGRPGAYLDLTKHVMQGYTVSPEDRLLLANYYSQIFKDYERAEQLYSGLIADDPNDVNAVSGLFYTYKSSAQFEKGMALLEDWLTRHPKDIEAQRELEAMKAQASSVSQ